MKKRFWLCERDGIFYLDDAVTRKKISLHIRDRREAERIRDARNEAEARPVLSVQLAKAYLSAHDSEIAKRTWQNVIDRFCALGKPQTQAHRRLVANRKLAELEAKWKAVEREAREFTAKADAIENAAYDLKAVNSNRVTTEDKRTPLELLDFIAVKGREADEALARLRTKLA